MGAEAIYMVAALLWMVAMAGLGFGLVFACAFITEVIAELAFGRSVLTNEKRPSRSRGA